MKIWTQKMIHKVCFVNILGKKWRIFLKLFFTKKKKNNFFLNFFFWIFYFRDLKFLSTIWWIFFLLLFSRISLSSQKRGWIWWWGWRIWFSKRFDPILRFWHLTSATKKLASSKTRYLHLCSNSRWFSINFLPCLLLLFRLKDVLQLIQSTILNVVHSA